MARQSQPAKARTPWRMTLPLFSVIILALLWTAYWFTALYFIKAEVAKQRPLLAARGMGLDCAHESWGGFPFRFTFACDEPQRTLTDNSSDLAVSSKKLTVYIQAWNFRHVIARLDGPTSVGSPFNFAATHHPILASVQIHGSKTTQITVEIPGLKIPGVGEAERLVLAILKGGSDKVSVAVTGTAVRAIMPDTAGPVVLDGLDVGVTAPEAIIDAAHPLDFMAETKSTIELTKLALTQGKLRLDGTGAGGLDSSHLPVGKISLFTDNLGQLAAQLAALEIISSKDGRRVLAMSALMPKDKDGRIALTLEAHDGGLYWGPVKLVPLQPVR